MADSVVDLKLGQSTSSYSIKENHSLDSNSTYDENMSSSVYFQNDDLISKAESISRIYCLFCIFTFILATCSQFVVVFVMSFMDTSIGPQIIPLANGETMLQPYLQILHSNGRVNICELKFKKSKFLV